MNTEVVLWYELNKETGLVNSVGAGSIGEQFSAINIWGKGEENDGGQFLHTLSMSI